MLSWAQEQCSTGYTFELNSSPIAYLLSQYPALTHTYLLREVLELRKIGMNIRIISIRAPDRLMESLSAVEREEAANTFYVKSGGIGNAIRIHSQFLLKRPGDWFRGLAYAVRLSRRNPGKLFHHLFYFAEAVIVGCWMQNNRLRHAHTHFASTVALILKKIFSITLSWTIHGPEEFDDAVGFHLDEKAASADLVFAISYYAQSQLMRASAVAHWHKIQVVPLGVHPETYFPSPPPADEGTFRLICVARLAPVKAQSILLQAVARLLRAGRGVELHLVGGGQDRDNLERQARELGIEEAVVFHGGMPQPRVVELLKTAHAFVLASFAEGVPIALMEAMALEVPCVATCIMGIPELIRDRVDGLLVPPSDVEGLSSAISELMDDAELRSRLGQAGRARVVDRYDLSRNVLKMAEVYRAMK